MLLPESVDFQVHRARVLREKGLLMRPQLLYELVPPVSSGRPLLGIHARIHCLVVPREETSLRVGLSIRHASLEHLGILLHEIRVLLVPLLARLLGILV